MNKLKAIAEPNSTSPEASMITEVETTRELRLCYSCRGPHFQKNCTNHKSSNSRKFLNKTTTWKNYKGGNCTQKCHDNRNNNNRCLTGNLSFQASQQIRSVVLLVSVNTIKPISWKHFQKNWFQKEIKQPT